MSSLKYLILSSILLLKEFRYYSFSSDAEISMTVLLWTPVSSIILIAVCAIISIIVFLSIGYACGWFSHKYKQSHTRTAEDDESNEGSQLPQIPGPLLSRSTPKHQDLVELKENVAYRPIIKQSMQDKSVPPLPPKPQSRNQI